MTAEVAIIKICRSCTSHLVIEYSNKWICGSCQWVELKPDYMLERWARWREMADVGELGGIGFIPKMMDSLKTCSCPKCWGTGRAKRADWRKTQKYKKCPLCKGKCYIRMDTHNSKVIPGLIRGTGQYKVSPIDHVAQKVDEIIKNDFNEMQRKIAHYEYCETLTQSKSAEMLGISRRTFINYLTGCLVLVSRNMRMDLTIIDVRFDHFAQM